MFQDEARFGRINTPKACWAPAPVRPTVRAQMVREYIYIFGAVSPQDGTHDSLILPKANTDAMSMFLNEVSCRHPDDYILMFMDQARWHTGKDLQMPEHMELAFLPPYSPELNPQEQVWDELREKFFGNKFFTSLQEVIDTAEYGLQQLESFPSAMARLTKRSWILNPV
jgi:transposase